MTTNSGSPLVALRSHVVRIPPGAPTTWECAPVAGMPATGAVSLLRVVLRGCRSLFRVWIFSVSAPTASAWMVTRRVIGPVVAGLQVEGVGQLALIFLRQQG